jgi:DnaJ like chaperone protein
MSIVGKLAGAFLGYLLTGGSFWGAIIGFYFGSMFDRGLSQGDFVGGFHTRQNRQHIQQVFFKTLFTLFGHIAKADGQISEDEIQTARSIMQQMRLSDSQKQQAMSYFSQGKAEDFQIDVLLDEYIQVSHQNRMLTQMLLEVMILGALADGELHANEEKILLHIFSRLGFSQNDYQVFLARVQGQQHFHQGGGQAYYQEQPREDAIKEAYVILGVSKDDSNAALKKAYRRQMNQHHPDKLVSRGMPEEMIKMATEKTQEIKAAYELLLAERKKN